MPESITLLDQKRIILGVSGSIAAYKVVDLASKLTQLGMLVDVVLTEAAQHFVTPLAFQSVTGRPVYEDLWHSSGAALPTHIAHVGLGESADLLAIIPATANTMARLAAGFSDDMISVAALAARCPLLIAPAMDGGMYAHPATQANLKTLVSRGAYLVEPETGRFASGLSGQGRLPETATLIGHIRRVLAKKGPLAGRHIVVTAGGTREAIDPVRYISNHSSGKQGYAVAQAALDAGAEVTLITTVDLPAPVGAQMLAVSSAESMLAAVLSHAAGADVLVMAAAVADFRPANIADQKIKKRSEDDVPELMLVQNPDILLRVRDMAQRPRLVVGFAAESEALLANARVKLQRKGLDLLVANDINAPDAGFGVDTNRVTLLDAEGTEGSLDLMSKARVGEALMARIAARLPKVD